MNKKVLLLGISVILLFSLAVYAYIPETYCKENQEQKFIGDLYINGQPAPAGTILKATVNGTILHHTYKNVSQRNYYETKIDGRYGEGNYWWQDEMFEVYGYVGGKGFMGYIARPNVVFEVKYNGQFYRTDVVDFQCGEDTEFDIHLLMDIPPEEPTCENVCELGKRWCFLDGYKDCVLADTGCTIVGDLEYCEEEHYCEHGVCESIVTPVNDTPVCENECELGESRCIVGAVSECVEDNDNCRVWGEVHECGLGYLCSGNECVEVPEEPVNDTPEEPINYSGIRCRALYGDESMEPYCNAITDPVECRGSGPQENRFCYWNTCPIFSGTECSTCEDLELIMNGLQNGDCNMDIYLGCKENVANDESEFSRWDDLTHTCTEPINDTPEEPLINNTPEINDTEPVNDTPQVEPPVINDTSEEPINDTQEEPVDETPEPEMDSTTQELYIDLREEPQQKRKSGHGIGFANPKIPIMLNFRAGQYYHFYYNYNVTEGFYKIKMVINNKTVDFELQPDIDYLTTTDGNLMKIDLDDDGYFDLELEIVEIIDKIVRIRVHVIHAPY